MYVDGRSVPIIEYGLHLRVFKDVGINTSCVTSFSMARFVLVIGSCLKGRAN